MLAADGRRSCEATADEAANESSSAPVRAGAARVRFVTAFQPGTVPRRRQRRSERPRRLRVVCLREARWFNARRRLGRVISPGTAARAGPCGSRRRHRDRQASSRSAANTALTTDEAITRPSRLSRAQAGVGKRRVSNARRSDRRIPEPCLNRRSSEGSAKPLWPQRRIDLETVDVPHVHQG
jgi:hypothetical protein